MNQTGGSFWRIARAALAALALTLGALESRGQDDGGAPDGVSAGAGEIDIAVEAFGVGGVARSGEWTGVRVITTDRASAPRQILIRAFIPDIDGDVAVYERSVASNPGERQGAWLYFRLPMWFRAGDGVRVTVTEAEETGSGFQAGRLLGQEIVPARNVLQRYEALIGIVGGPSVGLDQYAVRMQSQDHMYTPGAHEATEVSPTIPPEGLSDRWMGLMQFDALVWTGDQPGKLDTDRARALKEWVRRGGHLIVVIPPVGQTWIGDETYNAMADILPRVRLNRLEGVDLAGYRALLTDDGTTTPIVLPRSAVVHEFLPMPGAGPTEAIAILANPPGKGNPKGSVVVRRLVGTGAVTLVGIDLANRGLQQTGRPEADLFWHRVLGRRGKLYSVQELNDTVKMNSIDAGNRNQAIYDRVIGQLIDMSSSASKGVLLGFVVFITYWLVAAPVSYALLRKWGLTRHAWVAYAAAAALFTGIAWGGVTLIKPTRVLGAHVTLLDYVHSEEAARTRTWATLLIPWYGEATVSIEEPRRPEDPPSPVPNVITPWDTSVGGGDGAAFPDAREYVVESRAPDRLTFPTRSTVKQLQFDWAGGAALAGGGQMIRPVMAPDDPTPGKITLMPRREGGQGSPTISGFLVHGLKGSLRNVSIWIVRAQRPLTAYSPRTLISEPMEVWQLDKGWAPDSPLDLAEITRGKVNLAETRLETLAGLSLGGGTGAESVSWADASTALGALGFISQFGPPDAAGPSRQASAERQSAHGWDLGRWFTQPCVIVVGQLGETTQGGEKTPCLTPIFVDGLRAPLEGVTIVRWVYPLAADPPAYQ